MRVDGLGTKMRGWVGGVVIAMTGMAGLALPSVAISQTTPLCDIYGGSVYKGCMEPNFAWVGLPSGVRYPTKEAAAWGTLAALKDRKWSPCSLAPEYCSGVQLSVMTIPNERGNCWNNAPRTVVDDTYTTYELRKRTTLEHPNFALHTYDLSTVSCPSRGEVTNRFISGTYNSISHVPSCPEGFILGQEPGNEQNFVEPYGYFCRPETNTNGQIPNACKDYPVEGRGAAGYPVNLINRCKESLETDISTEGPRPIRWQRTYATIAPNRFWYFTHLQHAFGSVLMTPTQNREQYLVLRRYNGALIRWKTPGPYTGTPRVYTPDNSSSRENVTLQTRIEDWVEQGVWKGVVVINRSQEKEYYDQQGKLAATQDAAGLWHRYHYDAERLLTKIEDDFGHALHIGYLPLQPVGVPEQYTFNVAQLDPVSQQLVYETVTSPGGTIHEGPRRKVAWVSDGQREVLYEWSPWRTSVGITAVETPAFHLTKVIGADGGVTEYQYNNTNFVLEQVTDPTGRKTAYQYSGLSVVSEWKGAGIDGVGAVGKLDFTSNSITDQEGRTFGFTTNSTQQRITAMAGSCPWCNDQVPFAKTITYNAQNLPTALTDFERRCSH